MIVEFSNYIFYFFLVYTMASSPGTSQEQEFMVRIPARNERKNYHMMKFNASLNVDTSKWTQVRDNFKILLSDCKVKSMSLIK